MSTLGLESRGSELARRIVVSVEGATDSLSSSLGFEALRDDTRHKPRLPSIARSISRRPFVGAAMLKTLVVLAAGAALARSAREGPIPLYEGVPGGGPVDGIVQPAKVHVPADHPVVASHGRQLRYVRDSGVCENSTGSASGYIDVAQDQSMFVRAVLGSARGPLILSLQFWFFEARHDKDDADLVLWLNGGPGSSSMMWALPLFLKTSTEPVNAEACSKRSAPVACPTTRQSSCTIRTLGTTAATFSISTSRLERESLRSTLRRLLTTAQWLLARYGRGHGRARGGKGRLESTAALSERVRDDARPRLSHMDRELRVRLRRDVSLHGAEQFAEATMVRRRTR